MMRETAFEPLLQNRTFGEVLQQRENVRQTLDFAAIPQHVALAIKPFSG
jgi:hypothetical protein